MDVSSCYPFCELPDVNVCISETHELVRLIMQKEKLEFLSNTIEAKKYFYFHDKKHRITSALILRAFIIQTTKCFNVLIFYLWEENFRRGSFAVEGFTISTLILKTCSNC